MAGTKEPGISWHHTSVIIRADIYAKAHEQEIDISQVCNTALADLLGMDYCQQLPDNMLPVTRPVIIAQNAPPSEGNEHAQGVRTAGKTPVINADDPAAGATVRSAKRQPKALPAPQERTSLPSPLPAQENAARSPSARTAHAEKTKKPAEAKTHKGDGLKKFVTTKIIRSDSSNAVVSKDDMYQAFTRFCKEHKCAPVPDRKSFTLALKNKFAFFDKTVNGTPSWVNVRLK
jgi:hypothetical protein